ncbi:MAG: hypothetical protein QOD56_1212, partial [Gammaproteobacteria bacterium]|nr:hypothetical protein [Gammaproteobacteria bacterium]
MTSQFRWVGVATMIYAYTLAPGIATQALQPRMDDKTALLNQLRIDRGSA